MKLPLIAATPYIANAAQSVDPRAIGSMLLIGFLGSTTESTSAQTLAEDIAKQRVGGACFLGHNTKTKSDIEGLTNMFRAAASQTNPLIAVDQEGGAVQRLGKRAGYQTFPRAKTVAKQYTPDAARVVYKQLAAILKSAGFNLNLAPVVDLGIEPDNPVVYKWGRTFGADGNIVASYASAFIESHRQQGVLTAAKHFPGHGSTRIDSHSNPVDLTQTWQADEITPFKILAAQTHLDIVMSGHLSHEQITGGIPATLSKQALTVLRRDLGYSGVTMTDDLDMKAIRSSYELIDAVLRAIEAGYDLILLSNSLKPDPNLAKRIISAVSDAVKTGRLSANSIHESAERIAHLKQSIAQSAT